MLVVMVIVALLFALTWSAFFGLQTSALLGQASENLRADIAYAQRSAMLLNRESNESWVTGIGIDLTRLGGTPRLYNLDKWCTGLENYSDFANNASVPYDEGDGVCDGFGGADIEPMLGKRDVKLSSGELAYESEGNQIDYIFFEAITGIPHFYTVEGIPIAVSQASFKLSRNNREVRVIVTNKGEIYTEK